MYLSLIDLATDRSATYENAWSTNKAKNGFKSDALQQLLSKQMTQNAAKLLWQHRGSIFAALLKPGMISLLKSSVLLCMPLVSFCCRGAKIDRLINGSCLFPEYDHPLNKPTFRTFENRNQITNSSWFRSAVIVYFWCLGKKKTNTIINCFWGSGSSACRGLGWEEEGSLLQTKLGTVEAPLSKVPNPKNLTQGPAMMLAGVYTAFAHMRLRHPPCDPQKG